MVKRKTNFSDPTDALAGGSDYRTGKMNSGLTIAFRHVYSGKIAEFKGYITEYNDSFNSEWNGQETFGRMDEIRTFKNTKRTISISWDVPSNSREEAMDNFQEIQKMTTFLYPSYEDITSQQNQVFTEDQSSIQDLASISANLNQIKDLAPETDPENSSAANAIFDKVDAIAASLANIENQILQSNRQSTQVPIPMKDVSIISSPPIVEMKFVNWTNSEDGSGLYGTLEGFNFLPNLEEGVFMTNGLLVPMSCQCSVVLTVIHTDKLGWNKQKEFRTKNFPYNIKDTDIPK